MSVLRSHDVALWRHVIDTHDASIRARQELFTKCSCLEVLVDRGSTTSGESAAAQALLGPLRHRARRDTAVTPTPFDSALWKRYVTAYTEYAKARQDLLNGSANVLELVRHGLSAPGDRAAALEITGALPEHDRVMLFDELLALGSYVHGQMMNAQDLVLSLPRPWLKANIEPHAEILLADGTDEEYRALFGLFVRIDHEMARRLIQRARAHRSGEVREAGEDLDALLRAEEAGGG